MAGRLDDKFAIVTGAASGVGRETTLALARDGAGVLAVDGGFSATHFRAKPDDAA